MRPTDPCDILPVAFLTATAHEKTHPRITGPSQCLIENRRKTFVLKMAVGIGKHGFVDC
jgi:hypothetical protein